MITRFSTNPYSTGRLFFVYFLLAIGTLYNLYWGLFNPPTGNYFTTDEQFISDSGVLLLYGLTPRCFDWPAIPMVLAYYVLTLLHVGFDLLTHLAGLSGPLGVFSRIDHLVAAYLTDRSNYLAAGRLLQLTLSSSMLAVLLYVINRADPRRLPPVTGLFLSLLVVLNPDVLLGTMVIRPEAVAYPLSVLLTGLVLFGDLTTRRSLVWCLVLAALVVSQRLIFVVMVPFWIGGLLLRTNQFSARNLIRVSGGLVILLFLVMPFLWTDTLVLVKAFAGGVAIKVTAPGQVAGFNWPYLVSSARMPTNWVYGLTGIGGYFFIRQYPQRSVAWLLMGTIALYGLMVLRSPVIYTTHTMPLRCLSWPLIAYGGVGLCQWLLGRLPGQPAAVNVGVGVVGCLLAIVFLNEGITFQKGAHQPFTNYTVRDWLETLPAIDTVLMPSEFEGIITKSRTCLQRELAAIKNPELSNVKFKRLLSYVGGRKDTTAALPVLLQSTLSEDEKAAMVQHDLLIQYSTGVQPADTYFFAPAAGFINYYLLRNEALNDFYKGQYTYAVVDQPLTGQTPVKVFNQGDGPVYYAYARTQK